MLGKGVPAYSNTYGCLTYCIAGVAESVGWLRLYPLFVEPVLSSIRPIEKFDVIRVVFRHKRPEPTRPESRKIYPEFIEKIDYIGDKTIRAEILDRYTESGSFLHDDSWRGRKTLGMIKPTNVRFFVVQEGIPMVKFLCNNTCKGHTCEVGELMNFDSVGRMIPLRKSAELKRKLETLQKSELRFIMGTLRRYPQRWLLISIHVRR